MVQSHPLNRPTRVNTMTWTRRRFHAGIAKITAVGPSLLAVACSRPGPDAGSTEAASSTAAKLACNFASSYMTWDLPPRADPRRNARHNIPLGNKARIQLEAIADVIDEETGVSEQFVLIAPCRSEWVYAEKQMFQIPSREYRNIYSLTEERQMGRAITDDGASQRGHPVSDTFRSLEIDIVRFPRGRVLDTPAAVNEATGDNVPLIGRTRISEPERGLSYVLEYPIKTMNFRPENSSFQVDTGPLLVPDFDSGEPRTIDRLEMAHVVYNRLDYAEFILRRPTPINDEQGRELTRVLHYSEVRKFPAVTEILTGENA